MHAHALENLFLFLVSSPSAASPSSSSSSSTSSARRVLDVGSGSGYLTACLAHLVGSNSGGGAGAGGVVGSGAGANDGGAAGVGGVASKAAGHEGNVIVGIDHLPSLTALGKRNLEADGLVVGEGEQKKGAAKIVMVCGDGREGYLPLGKSSVSSTHPLAYTSFSLLLC